MPLHILVPTRIITAWTKTAVDQDLGCQPCQGSTPLPTEHGALFLSEKARTRAADMGGVGLVTSVSRVWQI